MTDAEFEALVDNGTWTHTQDFDIAGCEDRVEEQYDAETDAVSLNLIPHRWGYAWITSKCGDVTVTYREMFSFDIYDAAESFAAEPDPWGYDSLIVEGVTLVNEFTDPCDWWEVKDLVIAGDKPLAFRKIDYSKFFAGVPK